MDAGPCGYAHAASAIEEDGSRTAGSAVEEDDDRGGSRQGECGIRHDEVAAGEILVRCSGMAPMSSGGAIVVDTTRWALYGLTAGLCCFYFF